MRHQHQSLVACVDFLHVLWFLPGTDSSTITLKLTENRWIDVWIDGQMNGCTLLIVLSVDLSISRTSLPASENVCLGVEFSLCVIFVVVVFIYFFFLGHMSQRGVTSILASICVYVLETRTA